MPGTFLESYNFESSFMYVPKDAKERKWYAAEGQNTGADHSSRTASHLRGLGKVCTILSEPIGQMGKGRKEKNLSKVWREKTVFIWNKMEIWCLNQFPSFLSWPAPCPIQSSVISQSIFMSKMQVFSEVKWRRVLAFCWEFEDYLSVTSVLSWWETILKERFLFCFNDFFLFIVILSLRCLESSIHKAHSSYSWKPNYLVVPLQRCRHSLVKQLQQKVAEKYYV